MISLLNICGRGLAILVAAMLLMGGARAHSHKFKNLEIVHPWCLETQDATKPVAVFMTIRNGARQPDRLLRATTSIAAKAELRAAGADGNVVASVEVPSRGAVDLKRDGPQVRLSGVKKQLGAYDSFMMNLVFERAGKVQVEVMVEEASILEPAKH